MKIASLLVDALIITGLALPAITVYRVLPDFVFAYSGAALLALLLAGRSLARKGPHAA